MATATYELGPIALVHAQGEEEIQLIVKEPVPQIKGLTIQVALDRHEATELYETLKDILGL